jgi:cation-transporting ATPase E
LTETLVRPANRGLSQSEAQRRLDERGPVEPPATSRSTRSIVVANVFTVFNAILLVFGVLTLAVADWRDALFVGIIVANSSIGITQELRAKRKLDRLAALVAPHATVVRDGETRSVGVDEVVTGDLLRVEAGDQVVADGTLVATDSLALDESVLTGESDAVSKAAGEEVQSGSFAVEGAGLFEVTAVGSESYAHRIAGEAREFRHPLSPLERAINRLLFILVGVMVPLGAIFVYSLWERDWARGEAVTTAVAGIVTLIPEGLILLASLTFAAAAVQLARRGALAQQLNAIESLASVDVVCLDKTGTLTDARLRVVEAVAAEGVEEERLSHELGRFAASSPSRNATLAAIAEAGTAPPEPVVEEIPFSSRRRFSALRLGERAYVLGAPELFPLDGLAPRAAREARAGRRVLAFGEAKGRLDGDADRPPDGLRLLGVVVLAEELRPDARETVRFFRSEGVELKVLSGDAPSTVFAIATDAGIAGDEAPVDGSEIEDPPLDARVVGRITPEGKKRYVERLNGAGRYVAMVGDGVNDVPALKSARLAIAQGGGSQMARSVADVVLVNGDFASVPEMVGHGRKILRNVQRVTKLFVAKSVLAAFLILLIGLTETAYPLLPRHLTLAALLTVGIPGFFLALAPSEGPWRTTGFLRDVARFSVPAGTAAGLGVLSAYHFALNVVRLDVTEARMVATSVLVLVGLYLVLALEGSVRRRTAQVGALCSTLALVYVAVLAWAPAREFFDLPVPGAWELLAIAGGTGLAIAGLAFTDERFVPEVRRSEA